MATQARIYISAHEKLTNTDESLMAEIEGNKKTPLPSRIETFNLLIDNC
jgi:hypothetical protein